MVFDLLGRPSLVGAFMLSYRQEQLKITKQHPGYTEVIVKMLMIRCRAINYDNLTNLYQ